MKHLKEKTVSTEHYWYKSTVIELHAQFKQVIINIDDEVFVRTDGKKVLVFDGRSIFFLTDKNTAQKSMTSAKQVSKEESIKIEANYRNIR